MYIAEVKASESESASVEADPDFRTLSLLLAHANPQNAAHCTFAVNRPKSQPDRACWNHSSRYSSSNHVKCIDIVDPCDFLCLTNTSKSTG